MDLVDAVIIAILVAVTLNCLRLLAKTRSRRNSIAFVALIVANIPLAYSVARSHEWRSTSADRRELVRFLELYNAAEAENGPMPADARPVETVSHSGVRHVVWQTKNDR